MKLLNLSKLALAVNLINIPNQTTAPLVNSALYVTHNVIESGEMTCLSTNGTAAYTCHLPNFTLTKYTKGMQLFLIPDTSCSAACSLNVDGLGPLSLKQGDGQNDASFTAGHGYWLFFFGGVFRTVG